MSILKPIIPHEKLSMHSSTIGKLCLLAILLSGCSVTPPYVAPQMDIPCEWHSQPTEGMSADSLECFLWWESLKDPLLNSLMKRAAFQNRDLYIAGTRILETRAERKAHDTQLYPHLDASVNYGHLECHREALLNKITNCHHRKHGKLNLNFFEVGFDADWEIDLFGARAYEINALEAQVEASEESFKETWVTLSAEIARNYIELRSLQNQVTLINHRIASQTDTLHLTQELIDIGMASSIDLTQAQGQLDSLSAQKPLLELGISKSINRLSILIGQLPGDLFAELSEPSEIPTLPCYKPIGVPSELLRRRPDIRRAERNLAAATERIGSATAALFPRLTLRGFIGNITTHLSSLLNPAKSGTWFAGPQLLLPIFNSRLLKQDIDYQKIKSKQALFEYQKTVLEALEEAENAIASFHYELQNNKQLALAEESASKAYQSMLELYEKGFKSYLEVQLTNRDLLNAQNAFAQSQTQLLLHYIILYKALGGGWDSNNCTESNAESD